LTARNPYAPPKANVTHDPVRLEYDIRYLDLVVFNTVQQFLNPLVQGFFIALIAYAFLVGTTKESLLTNLVSASMTYLVVWILQVVFMMAFLFTRRSDSVLTHHVLELREDALYEATKFNESRHFWPGVSKVVQRPWFVAVYISQRTAHLIPMRAFQSTAQVRQFVALIKEKQKAA